VEFLIKGDDQSLVLPDFEMLEKIVLVLRPFETFTRDLSARWESISSIIPTYACLLSDLEAEGDDPISRMKQVLASGLRSRMQEHLNKKLYSRKLI
jgi:hypothetical protein